MANHDLSRRGFIATALAASFVKTTEAKANTTSCVPMPQMPSGLARGDAQFTTSGREGLKVYVTPYFNGGWTMYMFADRGNNVMLSTLFKSPSGKVVMIDGVCANKEYRHYRIKSVQGPNDFASMYEVITRRLTHGLNELAERQAQGLDPKGGKFSDLPDLIRVSGKVKLT